MILLFWIIFGALIGFAVSLIMRNDFTQHSGEDIAMGIIGGVVGGVVIEQLTEPVIAGFNFYSLIVAIIGAITVTYIRHIVRR